VTPISRRHEFLNATVRVLLDLCCILGIYSVTVWLLLPEGAAWWGSAQNSLSYLITMTGVWLLVATDQRLFLSRRSEALIALLFSVAKTFFTAFLFTVFIVALFLQDDLNRTFLFLFGLLFLGGLLLFRLLLGLSLWNLRRRGFNSRRILIIGSNERTQKLVGILQANEQYGYHIEGFLEHEENRRHLLEDCDIPFLGDIEALDQILINRVIDAVYIALPVRSHYEMIQSAAHLCEGVGVPVRFMADLFPLQMATSELTRVGDIPLLTLSADSEFQAPFALHRAIDMGVSLLLLVVLAPICALVSVAIKLDSRGPVLMRRPRHGPGGGEFQDIVFRTTHGASLDGGAAVLTRTGQLLRRYGIDELPQLLNVLAGDISLSDPIHGRGQGGKVDSPV
jgi:hypothetical protein